MSANFKCYNSDNGQVMFDLSMSTSRLLAVFGADVNKKTHIFSDDEMGGGELFWYTLDPVNHNAQKPTTWNLNSSTYIQYNELIVNITGRQIYFKKASDITLFVGVRV